MRFNASKTPYSEVISIEPRQNLRNVFRAPKSKEDRCNVMRLDRNEHTTGPSQEVLNEIFSTITPDTIASYPYPAALYPKLAKWIKVDEENFILTIGSDGAIRSVFEAFIGTGDKVILMDPTYAMYGVYCDIFGAKKVPVSFKEDFSISVEDLLGKINENGKLIAIANPKAVTMGIPARKQKIRSAIDILSRRRNTV